MEKKVNFQMDEILPEWLEGYDEDKFTVFKACFLSSAKNSHNLDISPAVLKRDAKTILGNFLVAKLQYGDASTHLPSEIIYGYFPKEQDVEFEDTEDGIIKAWAYCVISKQYGQEFNEIFDLQNLRNTSVEMKVKVVDDAEEGEVESFDIYGLTCLGLSVEGSCPDAMMTMIRFSQEDADAYFNKMNEHNLTPLKKFAKERIESMAKTYKIDKSKEAMSDADWSNVDKSALRDKIMGAENRFALVKATYMLIENGWEDAPSEKLKYPVMAFDSDTLVYYHRALSSALAYARQNNESTVVNKIEKIYKKLNLDDTEGKEEKMNEKVEFNETEQTMASEPEEAKEETAEMSETPAEMAEGEKVECAESEKVEGDESEEKAEDAETEEEPTKMSEDEMMAKIAELEKSVEERDHIIMDKDTELEELRAYKAAVVAKEMACRVDSVMEEVRTYINDEQFAEFKAEGLSCGENDIDAWSNKVKATCFSEVKKNIKKDDKGVFSFAMPKVIKHSDPNSIWEKLENK